MSVLTVVDPPNGVTQKHPPPNPFADSTPARDDPSPAGIEEERWNFDEGVVTIRLPKELSKESVDDLEYRIAGLIRRARRKAGLPLDD